MGDIKIREVPSWLVRWKIIPPNFSFAFAPYILLSESLYKDYRTGIPNWWTEAMIAHESGHIEREQAIGLLLFLFQYIFSNKFCFDEEMYAIKKEMQIYKAHGKDFDIENRAKVLSTVWIYHHCVSYEKAKEELTKLWDEIN